MIIVQQLPIEVLVRFLMALERIFREDTPGPSADSQRVWLEFQQQHGEAKAMLARMNPGPTDLARLRTEQMPSAKLLAKEMCDALRGESQLPYSTWV